MISLEFNVVVNGNFFVLFCFFLNLVYFFEKYECKQIQVSVICFDDWLRINNFNIVDFFCIDFQGVCLNVFEGMGDYFNFIRYIIVEFEIQFIYYEEVLYIEVSNFFKKKGFE